jgi:hypothetical protein
MTIHEEPSIMNEPTVSRRAAIASVAGACAAALAAPMLNFGRFQLFAGSSTE